MDLKVNLEQQARQSDWLVLWLDCDREGENIAYEVTRCQSANAQRQVQLDIVDNIKAQYELPTLSVSVYHWLKGAFFIATIADMQVIDVCLRVRPRLLVKRARFSALIARDLHHAVNNLVAPNLDDAKAVDARQEIDLRIGSSFTRMQTMLLQVWSVLELRCTC